MGRFCQHCAEKLYGRSDQKFCSDFCRNQFHNQHKRKENALFREVNRILKHNRNLLYSFGEIGIKEISLLELKRQGFEPSYFTSCQKEATGRFRYWCYDMIYSIEGDQNLVIEGQPASKMLA